MTTKPKGTSVRQKITDLAKKLQKREQKKTANSKERKILSNELKYVEATDTLLERERIQNELSILGILAEGNPEAPFDSSSFIFPATNLSKSLTGSVDTTMRR